MFFKVNQNVFLNGILNAIPRFFAVITKYALTILLIRRLDLSNYGLYQELLYYQALLIHFYGLELYFYFNKRYALKQSNSVIMNHLSLVAPNFLLLSIIAVIYLLFLKGLNNSVTFIFMFLAVSEYLLFESYRYLIAINRAFLGNSFFALRNIAIILTVYFFDLLINTVPFVLLIQAIYTSIVCLIVYKKVLKVKVSIKLSKNWIFKIKPHVSLILIMVISKFYEFGDKFIVQKGLSESEYGEYLAISTIGTIIIILVTTIVYQPYLGKLVDFKEIDLFDRDFRDYIRDTTIFIFVITCVLIFSESIVLSFLFENISSSEFYLPIVLGYSIMALSYIPLLFFFLKEWQFPFFKSLAYAILPVLITIFTLSNDYIHWLFPIVSTIMLIMMSSVVIMENKVCLKKNDSSNF